MNLEEFSLLNRSLAVDENDPLLVDETRLARDLGEVRLQCQCPAELAEPCPLLRADLSEYDVQAGSSELTGCTDQVELFNTKGEHLGVGLIWGHRWRSDPGSCEWVIGEPWRREPHHELTLLFPNLSSDPTCDSKQAPPSEMWDLFVFFHNYRTEYTEVTRDDPLNKGGFGSTTGDFIHAFSPPSEPPQESWTIPVNVWYEGVSTDLSVDVDIKTADEIYSGEAQEGVYNYTGIEFEWEFPQQGPSWVHDWPQLGQLVGTMGTACPQGSSGNKYLEKGAVNVYYPAKTDDNKADLAFLEEHRGWTCTDPSTGTAYVLMSPFDAYSSTSLAHHLGHVLGLDDVSDADGLTATNLMWSDPLDAMGLDARMELTLGQVFRINLYPSSWLNASPVSDRPTDARRVDCGDTQPCPAISLDIRTSQEIP
jgi:hypothetical protein